MVLHTERFVGILTYTYFILTYSRTHTFDWYTHVHILFTGILTYTYFLLVYSRVHTLYSYTHVHILFTGILTCTYFLLVYSRAHTFYWYIHIDMLLTNGNDIKFNYKFGKWILKKILFYVGYVVS